MTFEEFEELAGNPPYIEQRSVYRVDVHEYAEVPYEGQSVLSEFEVKRSQSRIYLNLTTIGPEISRIRRKLCLNGRLYAIYVYELPVNRDISNDVYKRLWVYNRFLHFNGQSRCSTLIEHFNTISSKFRGHIAESILFEPRDIVEIYNRENNRVKLGIVVKTPPTIEDCWSMYKEVEKACIAEGENVENTDDFYSLGADSDCYCVVCGPDMDNGLYYPRTYDVFSPTFPVPNELRDRLTEYYCVAIRDYYDKIFAPEITEDSTIDLIREIRRRVDEL